MIAFPRTIIECALVALLGGWLLLAPTGAARADDAGPDDGLFITVQNPITDTTLTNQIKNRIDRALNQQGRRIKKVVFDFNPGGSEAATPNYGSCRDFAEYIKKLNENGVLTIAFIHGTTRRHTVLPALACIDLVMSADAKIGEVAEPNEIVPQDIVEMYARVAGFEKESVVLKMLDKSVVVVAGLLNRKAVYVDFAKVNKKAPKFEDVIVSEVEKGKPVLPSGNLGLYNFEQAMRFQLCTVSDPMDDSQLVVAKFNLPASVLSGDRYPRDKIKAVKIEVTGPINAAFQQKLKSQLKEVRSRKENTIFFVLEYGSECGGSAKIAREIADEIRDLANDANDPVWTVAFIPNKAPDLATFIAFACTEIVMFKGSDSAREASIGDFAPFLTSASKTSDSSNTVEFIRRNLSEIAEQRGYSPRLVEGMIDRDAEILRVRDMNKAGDAYEFMTRREFDAAKRRKGAQFGPAQTIKQPGSYLVLHAKQAKELRVAQNTVDNRDPKEVYALYGRSENEVRDSKPGWLDDLAAFLRRTEIIFLLLAVAFAGLILEFKMPGATIPGLISLVCFVLFFWSQAYAHGATIYLAIGLFVLGLLMLAMEIFVLPGFGIMGIGGIILVLASLGLATMEKAPSSQAEWVTFGERLLTYGGTLCVACVFAVALARYLPNIPYANRLMLAPPTDNPDMEAQASLPGAEQAAAMLGQVGAATSMLRPAGMAKFGDVYVDVVTEGDFIPAGTSIQVIEVEGTRIVVKKV